MRSDADAAVALADKRARLRRDTQALEAKWVEVGCALESAEAAEGALTENVDG